MTIAPLAGMGGMMIPQMAAPKKGGMFGSGVGTGEFIQALLAGWLAGGGNPAGAMGMQMINQRRQAKDDEAQYQRRRGDHLADYAEMQKIQAQYGAPHTNDTVEDYNFRVQTLGKEAADEWLRNPPQYMNVPGVGLVQIPRSATPQMGAPAPQGVTFTPLGEGGPTQNGSGGFPRPY